MIPVMLVWKEGGADIKRHTLLPALPETGDLLIPPGEEKPRHVRAKEWDCRSSTTVIHIALD